MNHNLIRNQKEVRLRDYQLSIIWWLKRAKSLGLRVIIADNTNGIEEIKANIPPLLLPVGEYFQCGEDLESKNLGNSRGEARILKEVVNNYKFSETDFIWKVNGRLVIRNFSSIINKRTNEDMIINHFFHPEHLTDSRFFGGTPEVFKRAFLTNSLPGRSICDGKEHPNSNPYMRNMETFLSYVVLSIEESGGIVRGTKVVPIYQGFSATTNKRLLTKKLLIKLSVINLLRGFAIRLLGGYGP